MHSWKQRRKSIKVDGEEIVLWSYTKKHGLKIAGKHSLFIINSVASTYKDYEPLLKKLQGIDHVIISNLACNNPDQTIQDRYKNLEAILAQVKGKFIFMGDHEAGALCLMCASHMPKRVAGVLTIASVIDSKGFEADVLDEYTQKAEHYKNLATPHGKAKTLILNNQLYDSLLSDEELSQITTKVGLITYPGDGIRLGHTQELEKKIKGAKSIYAVGCEYHFIEEHAELIAKDILDLME